MTPMISRRRAPAAIAGVLLVAGCSFPTGRALSLDTGRQDVQAFITDLVTNEGFEPAYVRKVFQDVESRQSILDAISRPAERVRPWSEYRQIFITPSRISGGVDFYRTHEARLQAVAASTGVPAEMITAIIGVETFYGTRTGTFRVVEALSTLAFDYPPRSAFFKGELRHLFLLAREERLDVSALQGSYAGAMGPPQFIPSSYRAYAVDGDGDGRRDLLNNWDDIFASVANYFVRHNWQAGQPIATPARLASDAPRPGPTELILRDTVKSLQRQGVQFSTDLPDSAPALMVTLQGEAGEEFWVGFQNYYTITRYNRSSMYALAVFQLSEAIRTGVQKSVADSSVATP